MYRIINFTIRLISIVVICAAPPGLAAATFTVTNTNDAGPGSLRQALLDANADASATLNSPHLVDATGIDGTIGLFDPLPTLARHVVIQGPGAESLTVDRWAGIFRILEVEPGVSASVLDLAIANGFAPGGVGGGVLNHGNLTLQGVALTDNAADSGGGVANYGTLTMHQCSMNDNVAFAGDGQGGGGLLNIGTAELTSVTIRGNEAQWHGGGIANEGELSIGSGSLIDDNESVEGNGGGIRSSSTATLHIVHTTISANRAPGLSGGGVVSGGEITIRNSTINGNSTAFNGGGVTISFGAMATIEQTTVHNNQAGLEGGGLLVLGTLSLIASTVSNNQASSGAGIQSASGGILNLVNSTVSSNHASGNAGGVSVAGNSASITNSTLANNQGGGGANLRSIIADLEVRSSLIANAVGGADNCATSPGGQIQSLGYNLADDATCGFNAPGDQPVANALLAPLGQNGGPTLTHALGENSPAINKGISGGLMMDQRGWLRTFVTPGVAPAPGGDGTDIGAFELQPTPDDIFHDRFEL